MGTAGGVDHRHVSVRRSTAASAADRIDRIARLETLTGGDRGIAGGGVGGASFHTGPHKIIITTLTGLHCSAAPQTTVRSLAIRSSRNVYRIDQDPSFLRIDADILRS
jgi:hypothetical protein